VVPRASEDAPGVQQVDVLEYAGTAARAAVVEPVVTVAVVVVVEIHVFLVVFGFLFLFFSLTVWEIHARPLVPHSEILCNVKLVSGRLVIICCQLGRILNNSPDSSMSSRLSSSLCGGLRAGGGVGGPGTAGDELASGRVTSDEELSP